MGSLAELMVLEESVMGTLAEAGFPWDASEPYGYDLSKAEYEKLGNAPFFKKYQELGVVDRARGETGYEFAVSYRKADAENAAQAKKEFDSWYASNKDKPADKNAKIYSALAHWLDDVAPTANDVKKVQYKPMSGGVGLQSGRMYAGVIRAGEITSMTGLSVSKFLDWLSANGARKVTKLG